MDQQRTRVALVVGGVSSEHGVSCLTAASVAQAIDPERYEIVGVGITPGGRWVRLDPETISGLTVAQGQLPTLSENLPDVGWRSTPDGVEVITFDADQISARSRVDVAFALLHGPFGEDGTIQGMFEMLGLRYVGAGVTASAVGMDKQVMKQVLVSAGLPVGPFVAVDPQEWAEQPELVLDAVASLTFPVYVKPARGGSSLGISRVGEPAGVADAIAAAQKWDPKVIVEQGFVDAREVECGVLGGLGGQAPEPSPVAEIVMHTEDAFYDFDSKYLPENQVSLDVPADLPPELAEQVRDLALRTFRAVGAEGLARIDTFITHDGRIVVNEINTMPGFTEHSMFPRMWAAGGLAYPDLIDRLLRLAVERPVGLR